MCMLRITTYDTCWAQYTHVLICSTESPKSLHKSPQGRAKSALECPNLNSEHAHVKDFKCSCKTQPEQACNPQTVCQRLWGGDFVGEVNCQMLRGSAVRFEFRGREWKNCTNAEKLLNNDNRCVPDKLVSEITSRDWNDGEWDGHIKVVDWRDTDWVTLAQKGMIMWEKNQLIGSVGAPFAAMREHYHYANGFRGYNDFQPGRNEWVLTRQNQPRSQGKMHFSAYTSPGNYDFDIPSPPSVGQPRYQRRASTLTYNTRPDQAPHRRQFDAYAAARDRAQEIAQRIAQPSSSHSPAFFRTGATEISVQEMKRGLIKPVEVEEETHESQAQLSAPLLPGGPKMIPIWEAARILQERKERERQEKENQEKERRELKAPSDIPLKDTTGPAFSTGFKTEEDQSNSQHKNHATNTVVQVSISMDASSVPAHEIEGPQSRRQREKDEKRDSFLHGADEERVAERENKLSNQIQEAAQSVQDDTQDVDMIDSVQRVTPMQQDNVPRWNGVPQWLLPHDNINTLPDSDDRNFNFDAISPTGQPVSTEIGMVAPQQGLDHAPRYTLAAPQQSSHIVSGGPPLTSHMKEKSVHAPKVYNQSDTLVRESLNFQEAPDKRAMIKLSEIVKESNMQGNRSISDVLHDVIRLDSFLGDFEPSQQEIARGMWMAMRDKLPKRDSSGTTVNAGGEVAKSSYANTRHSGITRDDDFYSSSEEGVQLFQNIGMRSGAQPSTKGYIEIVRSKLRNEFMLEILENQDEMNLFVQRHSVDQQKMAHESWMSEIPLTRGNLIKIMNNNVFSAPGSGEGLMSDIMRTVTRRDSKNKLLKRLNQRVQDMIRNSTRSMRPKKNLEYEALEQQMFLEDLKQSKMTELHIQASNDRNLTGIERADIINDQQNSTYRHPRDQEARGEANIMDEGEKLRKRKRDVHPTGSPPPAKYPKKRRSGDAERPIEDTEEQKNKRRDLYYSGLIPSMDIEEFDQSKPRVERNEDQNLQKSNIQIYGSSSVQGNISSNSPGTENIQIMSLGNPGLMDSNEMHNSRDEKTPKEKTKKSSQGARICEIPLSFHVAYARDFPKLREETNGKFRKRKSKAWFKSHEYQNQTQACSDAMSNEGPDRQDQAANGDDLPDCASDDDDGDAPMIGGEEDMHGQGPNEANSGRRRGRHHKRKQPCQKDRLAKRDTKVAAIQMSSFEHLNYKEQSAENLAATTPLQIGFQVKGNAGEGEELPDYETDEDIAAKTESDSQSRNLIESQQALQSFIAQTRVVVKSQGMVIEVDDDEETVVDLTKGYAADEAIDLTSD